MSGDSRAAGAPICGPCANTQGITVKHRFGLPEQCTALIPKAGGEPGESEQCRALTNFHRSRAVGDQDTVLLKRHE